MISATIIADSISRSGSRITTFELEYPRFIHSELMTHRLLSRNAASSRAIPVQKMIELVMTNPAMPSFWGKNQPGMSAREECNDSVAVEYPNNLCVSFYNREQAWLAARDAAVEIAKAFNEAGYHKQIVNRVLEPYTHIKVVCTATEYDNFLWLRTHKDAQPEFQELANAMKTALANSEPRLLDVYQWHTPYYNDGVYSAHQSNIRFEDAIAISASCCAQVSYRKLDDSLDKAQKIFNQLALSMPPHLSPLEHQATPMPVANGGVVTDRPPFATHQDLDGNYWSGNFKGWTQYRQVFMEEAGLKAMTSQPVATMEGS